MRQTGVGAPNLVGDLRMTLGEALDVDLIEHAVVQRDRWGPVVGPVKAWSGYDAFWDGGRVVALVGHQILAALAELIRKDRGVPVHAACESLRVRIDEQLRGIKAQTFFRFVRPVDAIPVVLAGLDAG